MKTIVFAGGSSLLAQSWIREEQPEYNFILGVHKREPDQNKGRNVTLAYENPEELAKQFQQLKADIVVNCIGLTNVEACEKDEKLATYTNVEIAKTSLKPVRKVRSNWCISLPITFLTGRRPMQVNRTRKFLSMLMEGQKAKGKILYWIPTPMPWSFGPTFSAGGQVTNLLFQIKS